MTDYQSSTIKDREAKKELVRNEVIAHSRKESSVRVFRDILAAVEQRGDDILTLDNLSEGFTNYSYKISLKQENGTAVPVLYAKLAFEYALFHPDSHFDLERTETEYQVTRQFASVMNDDAPVARSYFCKDLQDGSTTMKLLVAEWSNADQQFGGQFIKGEVDARVVEKLAKALATLHVKMDCKSDMNSAVKDFIGNEVLPHMKEFMDDLCGETFAAAEENRVVALAKTIGEEECEEIADAIIRNYLHGKDCLIHGDSHVYNILVEPQMEKSFGERGDVTICDWEGSFMGPIGRDTGLFVAFPLACVMVHQVTGQTDKSSHILNVLDRFWATYSSELVKGGMDKKELERVYRNCIGWCGWCMFAVFYLYGCFKEKGCFVSLLPCQELSPADRKMLYESIGAAGLRMMKHGFGEEEGRCGRDGGQSVEELQSVVQRIVCEESAAFIMQSFLQGLGPGDFDRLSVMCMPRRRSSACSIESRRGSVGDGLPDRTIGSN